MHFRPRFWCWRRRRRRSRGGNSWRAGCTVSPAAPRSMPGPARPARKRGRNGWAQCYPLNHQTRPWRASCGPFWTKSSLVCPNGIGPPYCFASWKGCRAGKPRLGSASPKAPFRAGSPVRKSRLRDRLTRRGFALSAATMASVLSHDAHAVILPPILLDSTIRVATLVAAGSSLAGVVSTLVATLTEGVLKAMLLAKLKFAFLGFLTLVVVSTSVGVVAQSPAQPSDDDRLKSVERKLDKLLEVLGSNRPTAGSQTLRPDVPAPPATVLAPVPPPPPGTSTSGMRNMMRSRMMADGMRGMGNMSSSMGTMGGSMVVQPDLAGRVDQLERRLSDLEHRLGVLERRLTSDAPGTASPRQGHNDSPSNEQ